MFQSAQETNLKIFVRAQTPAVDNLVPYDNISPFIVKETQAKVFQRAKLSRSSKYSVLVFTNAQSGHGVRSATRFQGLPALRSKFAGCSITLTAVRATSSPRTVKEQCLMDYRIICTVQEPSSTPGHGHIVRVGTGASSRGYDRIWTVSEVYAAMDLGHRFLTYGENSGRWALVQKFRCCHRDTLKSAADAVTDNNLDSL